jgi:hypothetical protein
MKRLAAHRIFISREEKYTMHYVELDGQNYLRGIYPLEKEIAGTAFYNGTIYLSNREEIPEHFNWNTNRLDRNKPVFVFHSDSIEAPPPEFGTGDSRSNTYIQRFC